MSSASMVISSSWSGGLPLSKRRLAWRSRARSIALRVLRPEEGVLLLFPSYLFHRTLPFAGEGERISISFDLAASA